MPNHLPIDKQVLAISMLAEGSSIRSIERTTDIHRDTVMRLGVRVGQNCAALMDHSMRQIPSTHLELDEIWGVVGKKQRNVTPEDDPSSGSAWIYVALDPDTKIVPSFVVGKRDLEHTVRFTTDLANRVKNRVQVSTDGMNQYLATLHEAFGNEIDYGQIVKVYSSQRPGEEGVRKYSQPFVTGITKKIIFGNPDPARISTSYVERQNLTMRMHIRRLTRLTNAFSKKMENLKAAVALHMAYYNLVLTHSTLRCTPAMAAGLTSRLWTVEELIRWGA